jgi:molybdopterin molybdotransferase
MISLAEAQTRILNDITPLDAEIVALAQSAGRVTAAPVIARLSQPPSDVSAMDGYALREPDGAAGTVLRVIGSAPAGHPFAGTIEPGQCVRIFTGSVIPAGADAILIQENAKTVAPDQIEITESISPGRHIRGQGQDFADGKQIIAAGTRLSPRHIGLCASANHPWLAVHRRPRVAVLATGDEIALPGEPLPPGGIYGGNGPALCALAETSGAEATLLPVAPDNAASLTRLIEGLAGFDILLTIGGASVGAHDLVQQALTTAGMKLDFWKIAMRPGKPLIHGRLGRQSVIGVPGNPVAALLCGALFLRPLIEAMQGLKPEPLPTQQARLGAPLGANDVRLDFMRARLSHGEDGPIATALPRQDSAAQSDFTLADALILRAPFAAPAKTGEWAQILPMAAIGL